MIAKNTIRGSNQRSVVIHGTHNVTVVENIAYSIYVVESPIPGYSGLWSVPAYVS